MSETSSQPAVEQPQQGENSLRQDKQAFSLTLTSATHLREKGDISHAWKLLYQALPIIDKHAIPSDFYSKLHYTLKYNDEEQQYVFEKEEQTNKNFATSENVLAIDYLDLRKQWWQEAEQPDYANQWTTDQLFSMIDNGGRTFTLHLDGNTEEVRIDYEAMGRIVERKLLEKLSPEERYSLELFELKLTHKLGLQVREDKTKPLDKQKLFQSANLLRTAAEGYIAHLQPIAAIHAYTDLLNVLNDDKNYKEAETIYTIIQELRNNVNDKDRTAFFDAHNNSEYAIYGIAEVKAAKTARDRGDLREAQLRVNRGVTFLLHDFAEAAHLDIDELVKNPYPVLQEYANSNEKEKQEAFEKLQEYLSANSLMNRFQLTMLEAEQIAINDWHAASIMLRPHLDDARAANLLLEDLSKREAAKERQKDPHAPGPERRYLEEKTKYAGGLQTWETYVESLEALEERFKQVFGRLLELDKTLSTSTNKEKITAFSNKIISELRQNGDILRQALYQEKHVSPLIHVMDRIQRFSHQFYQDDAMANFNLSFYTQNREDLLRILQETKNRGTLSAGTLALQRLLEQGKGIQENDTINAILNAFPSIIQSAAIAPDARYYPELLIALSQKADSNQFERIQQMIINLSNSNDFRLRIFGYNLWQEIMDSGRADLLNKSYPELSTEDLMRQRINFLWKASPDTWGGLSREEIAQRIGKIAEILHLTPDGIDKITMTFGDNELLDKEGQMLHVVGACTPSYSALGNINHCRILYNRSSQAYEGLVAEEQLWNEKEKERFAGVLDITQPEEQRLDCFFETPEEAVEWTLAEELVEAALYIEFGTRQNRIDWERSEIERRRISGKKSSKLHAVNPLEIESSRQTVLLLAEMYKDNLERAKYFRDLHTKSVELGIHIGPNIEKVKKDLFIDLTA